MFTSIPLSLALHFARTIYPSGLRSANKEAVRLCVRVVSPFFPLSVMCVPAATSLERLLEKPMDLMAGAGREKQCSNLCVIFLHSLLGLLSSEIRFPFVNQLAFLNPFEFLRFSDAKAKNATLLDHRSHYNFPGNGICFH